jgi:hypothetical protein
MIFYEKLQLIPETVDPKRKPPGKRGCTDRPVYEKMV